MKKRTAVTMFSGLGGGALGLQAAGFELLAGFDSWQAACDDYEMLTGSDCHCVDLLTLQPHELRARVSERRPDVVLTSPPCKSFSGCLPVHMAATEKYRSLSTLAERGILLLLEAWEEPPPLICLENVPRIMSRGREWLDAVGDMLRAYGYAVEESTHDCGELGGLAQSRRRFLLVARHMEQVPEWLYEPPALPLRACGDALSLLPVPVPVAKDVASPGGPMHRLGRMSPLNWLRLALIPAGGDWRDLPDGVRTPTVAAWSSPSPSVALDDVADPRLGCTPRPTVYGVQEWEDESGCVIGHACHDNGAWSIADPRVTCERREGSEGVTPWSETSTTIIAHGTHFNGPWSVADPRSITITHRIIAAPDGMWACDGAPLDVTTRQASHVVIQAADGTWHRPMTTLELAALQGLPLVVDGKWLELGDQNKARWRERIGNAIPPATARAIGESMMRTLQAAEDGRLLMCGEPVWVAPVGEEVSP